MVKKGLTWDWSAPPPPFRPFFQASTPQLEEFISDLLQAGAIERTSSILFQGPLFSVPKKGTNKKRVILDLSTLNKSILCPTFRMTTTQDVRNILPEGAFTASLDLKDAYWHIPIANHFRKFLGFRIGTVKYRFRAMPFGLNIAPRIFTKICKPILQELRRKGIGVLVYLDDWLIWGLSVQQCLEFTKIVIRTLEKRGFILNFKKSRLEPSQCFDWLGIRWNTETCRFSIPRDKVKALRKDLKGFIKAKSLTRRQLERVMGRLQFASLVDPLGKALLKSVNHHLRQFARSQKRDWLTVFPRSLKVSVSRWLRPGILSASLPLRHPPPTWDIFTDASQEGWGAHSSRGHRLRGTWSPTLRVCHINILELVAVFLAIKNLPIPADTHIRLHSDNSTVVNCLNRMGSARSVPLNSWIISILRMLQVRKLVVSAFHIAGVRNVIADGLSRSRPLASEWTLDSDSFQSICNKTFLPQIDLFATRENHRLPAFVSPVPDSLAVHMDAFRVDWNVWKDIYLFPPSPMIMKVVSLLESFRGRALLITPDWPNQAWYPLLMARAQNRFLLPHPILSQRVGENRIYCTSSNLKTLLCWIF